MHRVKSGALDGICGTRGPGTLTDRLERPSAASNGHSTGRPVDRMRELDIQIAVEDRTVKDIISLLYDLPVQGKGFSKQQAITAIKVKYKLTNLEPCVQCGRFLNVVSDFYQDRTRKSGRRRICIGCEKLARVQREEADPVAARMAVLRGSGVLAEGELAGEPFRRWLWRAELGSIRAAYGEAACARLHVYTPRQATAKYGRAWVLSFFTEQYRYRQTLHLVV